MDVRRSAALLLAVVLLVRLNADGPQQAQPTFRSGVELVEVAVLVRDQNGKLVRDLTRAGFQIVEDRVPQTIVAFEQVSLPVSRSVDRGATDEAQIPRDVSSNERLPDARVFVLVLDGLHVDPRRTRVVQEYARRFIEQRVGPDDLIAVVSPGGLTSATQDFTNDKPRLLSAIGHFSSTKIRSATVERDEEARLGAGSGVVLHGGKDPSDWERAGRAQSLTGTLEALAGHLDRIQHRRKSLLLFSEGIDYDRTDVMGVAQTQASDVMRAIDRAIGALMRTNVAVYTIDPRALSSAEGDLVEAPLYRDRPDFTAQSVESEYTQSIQALRHVADSTGGFAAVNRNDIGPAFERIIEENSDYYILGYTPSKPSKPGAFLSIDVRVSRPGVTVFARKGYVVRSEQRRALAAEPVDIATPSIPTGRGARARGFENPVVDMPVRRTAGLEAELGALLASPLPRAGLPIRVQAIPFGADGKKVAVQLIVEVLGGSLDFTTRAGRFEERIDLAMLTVDDRARAANGTSTRFDLHLTADELQRIKATGVRWLSRLELPPGHYQVRVAGRATRSGKTGLVTHDLDVPAFQPERLSMSGVTITSLPSVLMITTGKGWLESAIKTPPSAARSFVTGDRLTVGFEVYVPGSLRTDVKVAAHVEWPDGSKGMEFARTVPRATGQTRGEVVAFPVDTTSLAPGRYVLHIALGASGDSQAIERIVPFEVAPRSNR
jgi:VWFA-related protein